MSMKVVDPTPICPYTGLRSFSEEESLYFKGRDEQIDTVSKLLEANKFLMVTGASGEGKSSLVYAGLISNVRAGFFKAKYNNWVTLDFRPERRPLLNMAKTIADKFILPAATIETELRRGFSSLVDLYINSPFYIDEKDSKWMELPDEEQKIKRRKASNLLIIVDQFEEFFTNAENFLNGVPSLDSQIVVNLVLETSRVAMQRNIPIYVVCTMRSDYIGQCTAFRGLPEFIGFSQFFVPRLKRNELNQIIEEPASLSGNRISRRLVERLIYDLSDGVDQLPILQHALSQIWLAANNGIEEMDLIHYAMVGGMPAEELPEEDQIRFEAWRKALSERLHKYYAETGLDKVIEIHANRLYEGAAEYFNTEHPGNNISEKQSKVIVAFTFACLTKIDHSRAVRNRMTLQEITSIINKPELTTQVVADIIDLYREEGNSFIRPFAAEQRHLEPETVLDITHESLIRNWRQLNKWANQEFEFYTSFQDLVKQLNRWKESNKSKNYLLPIGPLSYFENWYARCIPNVGWINRYTEKKAAEQSGRRAEHLLQDIQEFLKKSASNVMVTRAFMKYGAQKIATIAAIVIMLLLSGFYWYDAEQKKNERVIENVKNQGHVLLASNEVANSSKAVYLLVEERFDPGSLIRYLNGIQDRETRISLSIDVYHQLLLFDKHINLPIKSDLINLIEAQITSLTGKENSADFILVQLNEFLTKLAYDDYYNPGLNLNKKISSLSKILLSTVVNFFDHPEMNRPNAATELNMAIQLWLTFGDVTGDKLQGLLERISPLVNPENRSVFDLYYPKGGYEANGRLPNNFNGGYHTLAALYAASGDTDNVIWCFDQLKLNGEDDYFIGRLFNNYNNILGYCYQYGHRDKAPEIIRWLSSNYETNTPLTVYRNLVIRSGYLSQLFPVNLDKTIMRSHDGYFHPNLCLSSRKQFSTILEDYQKVIESLKDPSERNFQLAMHYKRRAMFESKYDYDRGLPKREDLYRECLDNAWRNFQLLDENYLMETRDITYPYFTDGIRTKAFTNKRIFIYPDYMDGWFSRTYHSDLFFDYLVKNNLLERTFKTADDLNLLHYWVARANELKPLGEWRTFDNDVPLPDSVLNIILRFAINHLHGKEFDTNLLYCLLANRSFERRDTVQAMQYFNAFKPENISASSEKYEYLEKVFFLNQVKELSMNLARMGKLHDANVLSEKFSRPAHVAYSYVLNADAVYDDNFNPSSFVYLDSAFSKMDKMDISSMRIFGGQPLEEFRNNLIYFLGKAGGEKMTSLAKNILRDIYQDQKFLGVFCFVWGVASNGSYYVAATSIPPTLTESQDLACRSIILLQACHENEGKNDVRWKSMDSFFESNFYYMDYEPN